MIHTLKKLVVVLLGLAVFGAAKWPLEHAMGKEMREKKLIPAKVSFREREKLGQAGYAITLGGLRPTLAALLNLRAYNYFSERDWPNVEDSYNQIVAIQPNSAYYWDMAAWQMGVNAVSVTKEDQSMIALERDAKWKKYYYTGDDFLQRGLEVNPGDINLLDSQVGHWTNVHRLTFPGKAVDNLYFIHEHSDKNSRFFIHEMALFFNLIRISGREAEAYEVGLRIWNESAEKQKVPMLIVGLFLLEDYLNIASENRIQFWDQFEGAPAQKKASLLTMLKNYLREGNTLNLRRSQGDTKVAPRSQAGIVRLIRKFEDDLKVPKDQRIKDQEIFVGKPW